METQKGTEMSKKDNNRGTPVNDNFIHWFTTDFHRTVVLVVGSTKSTKDEIFKAWKKYDDGFAEYLYDRLCDLERKYDYEEMKIPDRSGITWTNDQDVCICWFPTFPQVSCLAHELLHATQGICASLGIKDQEFEAYQLQALLDYFLEKLEEDKKKDFVNLRLDMARARAKEQLALERKEESL